MAQDLLESVQWSDAIEAADSPRIFPVGKTHFCYESWNNKYETSDMPHLQWTRTQELWEATLGLTMNTIWYYVVLYGII